MRTESPAPVLSVRDLGHRFPGGAYGIRHVSLSFSRGEFVIIAGRNGSGKTLLTRHLVGLAKPTEGQVLYRGRPISRNLADVRSSVGIVFQDADSQLVGQSIEEELRFGPENMRLPE